MNNNSSYYNQLLLSSSFFRQSQSDKLSSRCNQLQEKLNMAISTLQQALGGINSQVSETVDKVQFDYGEDFIMSPISFFSQIFRHLNKVHLYMDVCTIIF